MATHSALDPLTTAFCPTRAVPPKWTPRNNPAFSTHCRFYLHDLGNICRFGNSCRYLHAQELFRPTLFEQTSGLLQAVHQLILFAVACLQHTGVAPMAQAPSFAAEQREDRVDDDDLKDDGEDLLTTEAKSEPSTPADTLNVEPARPNLDGDVKQSDPIELDKADDSKQRAELDEPIARKSVDDDAKRDMNQGDPDIDDRHIDDTCDQKLVDDAVDEDNTLHSERDAHAGGKHFEAVLVNQPDLAGMPTLNTAQKTLSTQKEVKLWRHLLANTPQVLIAKYPKLREEYAEQHCLGNMDALLINLSKADLNGKPVMIRGRHKPSGRFIVQLIDHSTSPKMLRIKNENLQTLSPRPVSEAFFIFKSDVEDESWAILSMHNCCFRNENIIRVFVNNQFPFYDSATASNRKYTQLCLDVVKMAKDKGLGVTAKDCPLIISLLYCLAFYRHLHIVRIFAIPSSWTPQLWSVKMNLFVALPTTN